MSTREAPAHPARLIVAAAIIDDFDAPSRLLAARRSAPAALAGQWEFPGGKVEAGETPVAALHRELHEELGVRVSLGPIINNDTTTIWPVIGDRWMQVWLSTITAGTPQPLEDHDRLRWLTLSAALSVPWLAPDVPIVEAILRRIG